jgi:hypothetical protein
MRQLLAYLLVRMSDGTWDVGSHRNLEGLLDSWTAVPDAGACAVAHVGFWRPDTAEFEGAVEGKRGVVLLTEAAKWALPTSFGTAARPCAEAGGLRLFEALSGWGYEKEEDAISATPPTAEAENENLALDLQSQWLDAVKRKWPQLWGAALDAGIHDEHSYIENEWRLKLNARNDLASLRYQMLAGDMPNGATIIQNLRHAPPWLLALDVDALVLPTRPANRLAEERVACVGGMIRIGYEGMAKIPNMGAKSMRVIGEKVAEAWEKGSVFCSAHALAGTEHHRAPPTAALPDNNAKSIEPAYSSTTASFMSGLQEALLYCDEREMRVLELRMGLRGIKCTLDEIGKLLGITRERIRQVESKAVRKISALMGDWMERIESGINNVLNARDEPLPLVGLEVIDPWFSGVGESERPFAFALGHFNDKREFFLVRVDGQAYVSAISQEEWEEALRKTKALLGELVKGDRSMPEDEARCLAECMLTGSWEDLRPLLWKETSKRAHFSKTPTGESRLASFGMGAESIVEAVLLESERPLHFEEIARRCAARGREIDSRRARNAAADIGILLAPGTYGLDTHLPLEQEEIDLLVGEAENIILANPAKQWHADEIAERLGEAGIDFDGKLNKYVLNHALKSSQSLAYLGRMVWQIKSGKSNGTADRIAVWQAVAVALEHNGAPMRTEEIRKELSKDRGLGAYSLAVLQSDPVIKVGEATWGLLWRDVPFSEHDAKRLTDELEEIMRRNGEGLHISEIIDALKETADLASRVKDPALLVALAVRAGKIKSAKGGYIHPSDWENARRLCSIEAMQAALEEAGSNGWTMHALAARASGFLGREIPPYVASRLLISAGASFNEDRGVWFMPEEAAGSNGDDSDADSAEDGGSFCPPSSASGDSSASTAQGV